MIGRQGEDDDRKCQPVGAAPKIAAALSACFGCNVGVCEMDFGVRGEGTGQAEGMSNSHRPPSSSSSISYPPDISLYIYC